MKRAFLLLTASLVVFAAQLMAQAGGESPVGGVILDSAGNLYGTTSGGGAHGDGVVFKLSTTGKETVLHSFRGTDGANPQTGVIRDAAGNLYGTTILGGAYGRGAVFMVSATGRETVLHSFQGGTDGANPQADVIRDSAGNLYGTTSSGGGGVYGTVFKVSAVGKETVLYSFLGGADGAVPEGSLIRDAAGNLYGTTVASGVNGGGNVFKVSPRGKEIVLHSFGMGTDGHYSFADMIRDSGGNLYGTTYSGGTGNAGTVFKLSPTGEETLLYSFKGGTDAYNPLAGVVVDAAGNFYGTTVNGGVSATCPTAIYVSGCGTVFKLSPSGEETVLYSFQGGTDGIRPQGGVILDSEGNLYGTTVDGGANNRGTVFKLSPSGVETILHTF